MASFQEANNAAQMLSNSIGPQNWLLGVGVGKDGNDFYVAVRVLTGTIHSIPSSISGVTVKVLQQDMAKAY